MPQACTAAGKALAYGPAIRDYVRETACRLSATGYTRPPHAPTLRPRPSRQSGCMFLFFSNRLGWVGSILVSLTGTVLMLLLLASIF